MLFLKHKHLYQNYVVQGGEQGHIVSAPDDTTVHLGYTSHLNGLRKQRLRQAQPWDVCGMPKMCTK
jgi:hypothetical protein